MRSKSLPHSAKRRKAPEVQRKNNPNVFEFTEPQEFIREALRAHSREDPRLSQRYFCERIGAASRAQIYHYTSQNRRLPVAAAGKLADALRLTKSEARYLRMLAAVAAIEGLLSSEEGIDLAIDLPGDGSPHAVVRVAAK